MAWLAGYAYRKKGAVNPTTAGPQTNYQLKLVVGESSGASGEDVDCESNCQNFPNDIRFTKFDGITKYDYWIETNSITGTTPNRKVDAFIEVAAIPASGSVDFYMYYGKSGDTGESEGDDTFGFFDDFECPETLQLIKTTKENVHLSTDYCMDPNVCMLHDGTWFVVFREGSVHTYSSSGKARFVTSSNKGGSWSSPSTIYDTANKDDRQPNVFEFQEGGVWTILVAWTITIANPIDDNCEAVKIIKSTNGGTSWGTPITVTSGDDMRVTGNPIQMANGNILLPLTAYVTGKKRNKVAISDDDGVNWTIYNASNHYADGRCNELAVVEYEAGKLLGIVRNQADSYFNKITSANYGVTWTVPVLTNVPSPKDRPHLILLQSGDIALTYAHTDDDYRIVISSDNGVTWGVDDYCSVYYESGIAAFSGYPASIEYEENKVFSIFEIQVSSSDEDIYGNKINIVDVKWDVEGAISVSNGVVHLDNDDWITGKTAFGNGYCYETRAKANEQDTCFVLACQTHNVWNDDNIILGNSDLYPNDFDRFFLDFWKAGSQNTVSLDNWNDFRNVYYHYRIKKISNSKVIMEQELNSSTYTNTTYITTENLKLACRVWDSSQESQLDVDFALVRKYADPEPTWGSWGGEEETTPLAGTISAVSTVSGALTVLEDDAIGCVMTFEGGDTYNDQTIAANNDTINDVQTMFDTVGDILYYGDNATYGSVEIKYSTKGIIGTAVIVLEYSKGSSVWGTLSHIDKSNKFTEDPGTYKLSFAPPGDWASDTVNGKTHYWIRYRLTSSEYTTNPILDQLWVLEGALIPLAGTISASSTVSGALTVLGDYEDFTTFTEVDVGANRIQKTAYHIDHLSYRNETTYLYKDYGAAHFDDFEHRIKVRFVSASEAWGGGHTWLLANDIAGSHWMEDNNKTYISIFLLSVTSNIPRIWLREMHNGSGYDDTYVCSFNTWYYVKIVKSSTSLTAYIYSDSDYSTLLDTLILTLHANHTLRYLYGCNSDNDGTGRYGTLDVENFDLSGATVALAGTITATSGITGVLGTSKKVNGSVASTTDLTAALSCKFPISGTISATSSVSGTLTKKIPFAGVVSALSTVSGTLRVEWALTGMISATSSVSGALTSGMLAGTISATSSVSGALRAVWALAGVIPAVTSISGALNRELSISGTVSATSSVSGTLTKTIALSGIIPATSSVSGSLRVGLKLSGVISASSSLQGALSAPLFAQSRGFYYAKLGSTILTSLEKDSFRITEELNKIPSFEFEISNCAANRAAITAGITDTLTIYRRLDSTDTLMFTGRIDVDAIEYLSLERIRIPGYASYIDLNFRFHQHLNSEDAEDVGKVFDYSGSYTDYTTAANNDTTNDVLPTFGGANHALYIGQGEQFFGAQVKYSTKGVQAGSTTVVFEFSKGSGVWSTLDVLDETRAFTEDPGTYYITIPHKPSDWAKDTVNSVKKFWIRARVTAGSYTTSPKLDRIKITNVDVYRVYYFNTAANSIMDDVLDGTGYSMDGVDVCPSNPISMVGEYETKLRFIAGVANALTWDDSGDKKAYQWWIDTSKKVHFKQKRGAVRGNITQDLVILNNVMDYFNLSNRLHFLGNYDGLNQLRAVIEDTSSQDTHAIRELAVIEERYNNYTPLKEAAQKAMTHTKAPLQKIPATLPTTKWLANNLEVGDTVTIHQPRWNIDEQALQIVRADIGPSTTKLDIGISQEHLDGLKAGLQRRLDISGIRMHGSTSLLQFGPETMNYQRVDATTVYPARLKFEIPSDARYIHKILISWKLGNYRADVTGGEESEGHDHTGFGGAGGAHEHGGFAGAGGAHDSSVLDGGLHTPTELSKAHKHTVTGTINWTTCTKSGRLISTGNYSNYENNHVHPNPDTGYESNHTHPAPSCGSSNSNQWAVTSIGYGTSCTSGACVDASTTYGHSVAVAGHSHSIGSIPSAGGHDHYMGNTGQQTGLGHRHAISNDTLYQAYIHCIDIGADLWTSADEDPAHIHTINEVQNHHHTAVAIAAHANHVIGTQIAHGDHSIVTQAAAMIDIALGIVEIAGGTTMMLTVNGEDVTTVDGDGTDIIITGFCNTGSNSVELAPIVGSNVKGGCTTQGRGVIFIESKKF